MQAINDIPATADILDGDLSDLLQEINNRFGAVSRNFAELQDGDRLPATRTANNNGASRNPYNYVNPVINVYDFLDPLYSRLRTAQMQLRELDLLPNSVGQNQLQIDSVIARHIVAGSVTADKIDVNELSAIAANIGTITSGNITLDTTGFIRGGATTYASGTGFWMGYDGGAYKFFLGSHSGDFIQWDGANLTLSGSASIVGSVDWTTQVTNRPLDNDNRTITVAVPSASPGLFLGSNYLGYHNGTTWKTFMDSSGNFYLGGTSGALTWNGTTLAISHSSITGLGALATQNTVSWSTDVTSIPTELTDGRITTALSSAGLVISGVKPGITVTTGAAGLYLGSDFMGYYNGSAWRTYLDNTGKFYLGGTSGKLQWDGTNLLINGGGTFSGALSAATGSFSGSVTASSGTIGGWTLGANALTAGSGSTTVGLDSSGSNPALYAGSATPSSAPFKVTNTGALVATNATITGAITATSGSFTGSLNSSSGTVGGWTLSSTSLTAGSGSTTVGLDSGGSNPAFYAGSSTPSSAPFRVSSAGVLVATNATLTGSITSTSGSIGGFTIGANSLTGTDTIIQQSSITIGSAGTNDLTLSGGSGLQGTVSAYHGGQQSFALGYSGSSGNGKLNLCNSSGSPVIILDPNATYWLNVNSNFLVASNGKVDAVGYRSRAGVSGAYSGNYINFYWNGSAVELWVDVTKIKDL